MVFKVGSDDEVEGSKKIKYLNIELNTTILYIFDDFTSVIQANSTVLVLATFGDLPREI